MTTRLCLAVALLALACAGGDQLIPEHGKYSQTYQSDWASLSTGKELAHRDLSALELQQVDGPAVRRVFKGNKEVRLTGDRLRVHWPEPGCDKYRHTLYLFQDCERVVIDDMVILNADPDFRASSTFFFEGCGRVEIRNCTLGGANGRSMIRLEGCEEYFIDRVEITGLEYPGAGMKSGPGIFINNGAGWDEEKDRPGSLYTNLFRELKWGVIQNCYVHDHPNLEPNTNHDGILFHAPADGLVFNCVFENYEGDSCLDISHRRSDPGYQNHHYRLERNIFDRCHRVKTNGAVGSANCSILWCNNLYLDSMMTDYHEGWVNRHEHETFINHSGGGYFLTMYCRPGGTVLRNCLIYCPETRGSMYESWGYEDEDDGAIQPDYNIYFMPGARTWLKPRRKFGRTISTWDDWQTAGFDRHSMLTGDAPQFVDLPRGDYRPRYTSPAAASGVRETESAAPALQVSTDFYGAPRPRTPSVGAFEPPQTQ